MRKKKKKKTLYQLLREFETYDTIYYDGRLTSFIIVLLIFLILITLGVIVWMI